VLALGAALGWPILADARSGCEVGIRGDRSRDGILRADRFADGHTPECIVALGERWVSKVVNGFLARAWRREHSASWSTRGVGGRTRRSAAEIVRADPTLFARAVTDRIAPGALGEGAQSTGPWMVAWQRAEERPSGRGRGPRRP